MDQPLAKLRPGGIFLIDMERIEIHGQTSPIDNVVLSHGYGRRRVHIAHIEIIAIFAVFHMFTSYIKI
jgi:hypothetical protein